MSRFSPKCEIIGSLLFPIVGVFVLFWAIQVKAIAPYATYEQLYQYSDGTYTTQQTALLQLSDFDSGGELQVGDSTLLIQASPPRIVYSAREVGAIPRSATVHTEEACLVSSASEADSAAAASAAIISKSDQEGVALVGRRLLATSLIDNYVAPVNVEADRYAFIKGTASVPTVYRFYFADADYRMNQYMAPPVYLSGNIISPYYVDFRALYNEVASASTLIARSYYMRQIKVCPTPSTCVMGWDLSGTFMERNEKVRLLMWSVTLLRALTSVEIDVLSAAEALTMPGRCFADPCVQPAIIQGHLADGDTILDVSVKGGHWKIPGFSEYVYFDGTWKACFGHRYHGEFSGVTAIDNSANSYQCDQYVSLREAALKKGGSGGSSNFDAQALSDAFQIGFDELAAEMQNSIAEQISTNNAAKLWTKDVGIVQEGINNLTIIQNNFNAQLVGLQKSQNGINVQLNDVNGRLTSGLQQLAHDNADTAHRIYDTIDLNVQRLTTINDATNNNTNAKFAMFRDVMKSITDAQQAQNDQLSGGILQVSDMVLSLNGIFSSYVQKKQFNRLLTQSFYQSLAGLRSSGSEEVPLVSADGIEPTAATQVDLKALVDVVRVTYTNDTQSTAGKVYEFSIYVNTQLMLNMSRSWTTVQQLVMWMGVRQCVIPWLYNTSVNATQPTNSTLPFCTLWMEVSEMQCYSGLNVTTADCLGTNTTVAYSLLTSTSYFNLMTLNCQRHGANNTVIVGSSNAGSHLLYANNNNTCTTSFHEKMLAQSQGTYDPAITVFAFGWMAYQGPFQSVMRSLELKLYGQLPDGVRVESKPLGYSSGSAAGYNGGMKSVECMLGHWLSVSPVTLPITALNYDSTSGADRVQVSIVNTPVCTTATVNGTVFNGTAGDPKCYTVTNADLAVNFVLQGNFGVGLPYQLVMIGNSQTVVADGVYDAPASLIETTRNSLVRRDLLTYLLMEAGTTETQPFDYFHRMSGGSFDPVSGSASAKDYRFASVLDNEGYPVCNIAGAFPVSATFATPVDGCVAPFVWSNSTTAGPFVNAVKTGSSGCFESVTGLSTVLFDRLQFGANSPNSVASLAIQNLVIGTRTFIFTVSAWVILRQDAWITDAVFNVGAFNLAGTWPSGVYVIPIPNNFDLILQMKNGIPQITLAGLVYVITTRPFGFVKDTPVFVTWAVDLSTTTTGADTTRPFLTVYMNGEFLYRYNFAPSGSTDIATDSNDIVYKNLKYPTGGAGTDTRAAPYYLYQASPSITLTTKPITYSTLAAEVRHVTFASYPMSAAVLQQRRLCEIPTLFARCWLPPSLAADTWDGVTVENAVSIVAYHRPRTSCLSYAGVSLSVSSTYDTTVAVGPVLGPWTMSLFFRLYTTPLTIAYKYDPSSPVFFRIILYDGANYRIGYRVLSVTDSENGFYLDHLVAGVNQRLVFGRMGFTDSATSLDFHFMSVSVSADGSAVMMIDGLVQSGTTLSMTGSDWTDRTLESLQPGQVVYLYPGMIWALADSRNEMQCQLNSFSVSNGLHVSLSPSKFSLPVAVCEEEATDSKTAYCRHRLMCGGNCAAYSLVDHTQKTFTVLQVVCDPGWLAPDCIQKCTTISASGLCLDVQKSLDLASGATPGIQNAYTTNGYWCQILKNYQMTERTQNNQTFVDLYARSYSYLTDIAIPDGKIVTVVPKGNCPSIALQANGDGSIWMIFTNVYATFSTIVILTSSSPASNLCVGSYREVLPPFKTVDFVVPSLCANLALEIRLDFGNGYEVCNILSATTVAAELARSRTASVPSNIVRNSIVTGNEVLLQLAAHSQALSALTVQFQAEATRAASHGIDASTALNQVYTAIAAIPLPNPDSSAIYNLTATRYGPTTVFDTLIQQLNALHNATTQAINDRAPGIVSLAILDSKYQTATDDLGVAITNERASNLAYRNQLNASNIALGEISSAIDNTVSDLAYRLAAIDYNMNSTTGGLSPVMFAFFIFGAVVGILSGMVLVWPYAKQLYNHIIHQRKVHPRKKKQVSDSESSDSEPETDQTPVRGSGAQAIAISQARESYTHPYRGH